VRARYAEAALSAASGDAEGCGCGPNSCCGPDDDGSFGATLYGELEQGELPDAALLASLGCDNPLARRNAAEAGASNVEFLKGQIEAIPLPDESVDVVISNCVLNLSTDKAAVIGKTFRVLRPGGRVGVSDVVAEDRQVASERAERRSYVGCVAGTLSQGEYETLLRDAGFEQISVTFTHEVADGMHGAIVEAVRPA
jgi:SAM-dependent methyltransferase